MGAKIHFCILLVLEVWDSDRTVCIAVGLWYRMMSAHKRWVFQRAAAQQRQRRLALKPPLLFSERWLHDVCYCGLKKCFFIAWPLTTFVQPSIISKLNLLSDFICCSKYLKYWKKSQFFYIKASEASMFIIYFGAKNSKIKGQMELKNNPGLNKSNSRSQ